jgi:hypothetical protein
MKWLHRSTNQLLSSPILWGVVSSTAFQVLLRRFDTAIAPSLRKYLTGQWDSYVCTTMFFIAIAFFIKRAVYLGIQWAAVQRCVSEATGEAEAAGNADAGDEAAARMMNAMEQHAWATKSLLYRRLHDARQFRQQSGDKLSARLQELSEADAEGSHMSYGLLRLLIWAIPSCGCLATIMAIAKSLEQITPGNPSTVLSAGTASLSEAFTTFAFFVGLAILLVVCKFVFEQAEQQLLRAVDHQTSFAFAAARGNSSPGSDSQIEQFQQLTETLKAIAGSLSQQVVHPHRSASEPVNHRTAPGVSPQEMEQSMQRAIAAALQGHTASGSTASFGPADGSGWKALQQVLQKLAAVLEQQNAKLDAEGRVIKHLSAIIGEETEETQVPIRVSRESRHEGDLLTVMGG